MELQVGQTIWAFNVEEGGLCKGFLFQNHDPIYLGSDTWPVVYRKLYECLFTTCHSAEYEAVLMLFKGHHTLYLRATIDGLELCWEEPSGEMVSRDVLVPHELFRLKKKQCHVEIQ